MRTFFIFFYLLKKFRPHPHHCSFVCVLFPGRPAELPEDCASLPLHSVAGSRCAWDHPVACSVCENCERLHRQGVRLGSYCGALQVWLNRWTHYIYSLLLQNIYVTYWERILHFMLYYTCLFNNELKHHVMVITVSSADIWTSTGYNVWMWSIHFGFISQNSDFYHQNSKFVYWILTFSLQKSSFLFQNSDLFPWNEIFCSSQYRFSLIMSLNWHLTLLVYEQDHLRFICPILSLAELMARQCSLSGDLRLLLLPGIFCSNKKIPWFVKTHLNSAKSPITINIYIIKPSD